MHERMSLFKNQTKDFIAHGKLTTTKQKAKSIQGSIDHLVASVRKDKVYASREALKVVGDKKIVAKLVGEIAPLFVDRVSGFTRIIPLGLRSDTASMVRLEWVVDVPTAVIKPVQKVRVKDVKTDTKKLKPQNTQKAPLLSTIPRLSPKLVKTTKQSKKFQTPASAMKPSNSK